MKQRILSHRFKGILVLLSLLLHFFVIIYLNFLISSATQLSCPMTKKEATPELSTTNGVEWTYIDENNDSSQATVICANNDIDKEDNILDTPNNNNHNQPDQLPTVLPEKVSILTKEVAKDTQNELVDGPVHDLLVHTQRSQQKLPTFSDIVSGFSKQVHSTNIIGITMEGSSSGCLTVDQIREGRFIQRLCSPLISTWKLHAKKYPLVHPLTLKGGEVMVYLNKDGSIKRITIQDFKDPSILMPYIKQIVQEASRGFPTLPPHTKNDTYCFIIRLAGIPLPDGPRRLCATQY